MISNEMRLFIARHSDQDFKLRIAPLSIWIFSLKNYTIDRFIPRVFRQVVHQVARQRFAKACTLPHAESCAKPRTVLCAQSRTEHSLLCAKACVARVSRWAFAPVRPVARRPCTKSCAQHLLPIRQAPRRAFTKSCAKPRAELCAKTCAALVVNYSPSRAPVAR